jgi:predicted nucleic acid-binding protein
VVKLVIDANVAIKWVLPEAFSETALSILDDEQNELLVPDFFFSEITNILWKRIQRKELSLEKAKEGLESIRQVDFKIFSSYDLVTQALELSVQLKQSVYDCIYVALAIAHDCQMITADERLINAVQQNSDLESVVWLGIVSDRGA